MKTLALLLRLTVAVVIGVAAVGLVVITAPDLAAALLHGFGEALTAGSAWIVEEVAS